MEPVFMQGFFSFLLSPLLPVCLFTSIARVIFIGVENGEEHTCPRVRRSGGVPKIFLGGGGPAP